MMKKILLGNEAIIQGALSAGVSYVSGYPGCPSAEIGDDFAKIAAKNGVYVEWATNEKVGLESAIGASFSGLKSLVNMKSFGINVCSDSLLPLAYTGTKGAMVIVVADDPSCWSSAQTEQNTRAYSQFGHIPTLEPADPQECYDFTKLAFEISEKFNTPVILHTTTRVNHQKMPVLYEEIRNPNIEIRKGEFVKDPHRFTTMPPRTLEQKKELLEKIKKIQTFAEKSKVNKIDLSKNKVGIVVSGVSYLHVKEALEELKLNLPILKLGFFYPLPEEKIKKFIKPLKKLLVVEELDNYLEREINVLTRSINPKLQIFGKNLLPVIGELNTEKIYIALAKITGRKFPEFKIKNLKLKIPNRTARLCEGCPYWYVFPTLKRVAPDAIFTGDIGCNMIAGFAPHNIQDTLFSMGASLGIAHGVSKSTNQKVISIMGDGTFFHAGISPLLNAVYNKSKPLMIILDNRITAMTGHQQNPGMGKTLMGEVTTEVSIEEIARACGVKNVKVLDPINIKELESTVKEFLAKDEVSLIICKRICALLERRQAKK
ncbi:MAG: thiamine pyrophosphate-dependent enzyme [Candidatus Staskawiczbacteria bacterium]|jgi:indolepyruvate ferredoxin oxidoreductase alpha subunit